MPGGRSTKRRSAGRGGDQNIIDGNISGGIVVQGRNATLNQTAAPDAAELSALFDKLYQQIKVRADDPNVDKDELTGVVQDVQKEAAKGDEANQVKLARWLTNLAKMAPDILDVALASLAGPISGFAAVFKKIAERARASAAG